MYTQTFLSKPLVTGAESSGDIDQAKVSDDGTAVLQENVFCLEILVDNAPMVEVAHPLGDLLGDQRALVHRELVLPQMQCGVESVAFTQRGHYGQPRGLHTSSHEQDQVLVASFPEHECYEMERCFYSRRLRRRDKLASA